MKPISDLIQKPKQTSKVNSAHQEQILAVLELMGETITQITPYFGPTGKYQEKKTNRYSYWSGRLKKYTPDQIYLLIKNAKQGKNPPALFQWLLKNK